MRIRRKSGTDRPFSETFHTSLDQNAAKLKALFGDNLDFAYQEILSPFGRGMLFYFSSLVSQEVVADILFRPLQEMEPDQNEHSKTDRRTARPDELIRHKLPVIDTESTSDFRAATEKLAGGMALLLLDGHGEGLLLNIRKTEKRNIAPPETEQSVIGSKESFIEDLNTNIALIRQTLPDPNLRAEPVTVAVRGTNKVAVLYMSDVANPQLVEKVKQRLGQIRVDAIHGQAHLEELIEGNSFSLFPQLRTTERPDVATSYLLEGHVLIILPNAAQVLIAPITFMQFITTIDDYYSRWQYATLVRFVRIFALLLSILLPGLYISLVAYNPELIPTRLVISMDASRTRVALPSILEILAMEISIEILREAGIKLPKPIGQAVSIIGGLVIGEAAANANLVSPVTVVIVALTAISSFSAPLYALGVTLRVLRFFLILCSAFLGLYGLLLGFFLIHIHLCKLNSFGVSYLSPFSPLNIQDWKDTVVRFPFKKITKRPGFMKTLRPTKSRSYPMKEK